MINNEIKIILFKEQNQQENPLLIFLRDLIPWPYSLRRLKIFLLFLENLDYFFEVHDDFIVYSLLL